MARRQLLEFGYSTKAIEHRICKGRLHPVRQGVYAIGRPALTRHGLWMAAVLSCGLNAFLSHESAAELWRILPSTRRPIEVRSLGDFKRRRPGIVVHRRTSIDFEAVTRLEEIPVTAPIHTLIDLATRLGRGQLEVAVNEADKRDLTDPETLREALEEVTPRPGVGVLRELIDSQAFTLTDSELERLFIPIALSAGLPCRKRANESTDSRSTSTGETWD